jgi:hypothetical protein
LPNKAFNQGEDIEVVFVLENRGADRYRRSFGGSLTEFLAKTLAIRDLEGQRVPFTEPREWRMKELVGSLSILPSQSVGYRIRLQDWYNLVAVGQYEVCVECDGSQSERISFALRARSP